jgi:hypothetical protein
MGAGLVTLCSSMMAGCPEAETGCENDLQCEGDRICEYNQCVDPAPRAAKPCGEIIRSCGCGPTTLTPGQVTNNQVCESGQGISDFCSSQSCPGGGYPWATTCYCGEPSTSNSMGSICGDGLCDPGESCEADCGGGECDVGGFFGGQVPCLPLGSKGNEVSGELVGVWNTQPSYVCGYPSAAPPNTGCGFSPPNNAVYCPLDGGISLDFDMLNALDLQFGNLGSIVVFAHEWGHLNQHALGLLANGPSVFHELHADCQAGLFTAALELSGNTNANRLAGAFASICQFGDPAGYPWFAPGAHGTCQQRTAAFQAGYEAGKANASTLCSESALQIVTSVCGVP